MSVGSRISVAMCTFNGEKYLSAQLDSIARQSVLPYELVICDDSSTDTTGDVVLRFAQTVRFPVRFHKNETNLGSTKNFERAISLCSGDLIALSDQDDIWYPEKLATLSSALEANPEAGGVFSDADLMDEASRPRGRTLWQAFGFDAPLRRRWHDSGAESVLFRQEVVTGATLMFRADLKTLVIPISALWIHDAWIAWIIAFVSPLDFVESRLIRYRVHASQREGIPKTGPWMKLRRALKSDAPNHARSLRKYQDLADRLMKLFTQEAVRQQKGMNEKIEHLRFRATLPDRGLHRVLGVLKHFPGYMRFTRGLPEIVKDLLCA